MQSFFHPNYWSHYKLSCLLRNKDFVKLFALQMNIYIFLNFVAHTNLTCVFVTAKMFPLLDTFQCSCELKHAQFFKVCFDLRCSF